MPLLIHDTLAREKRAFAPRDPSRVTLYVCGPTVWSYAHIGNARPVVVFDVLFRLLRRRYGEAAVVYARNITDVDDKINAAAAAVGVPIAAITDRFTAVYHEDMAALGALPPTLEPRATAHIDPIVAQIGALIQVGAAYAAEGHVLFAVDSYAEYGALSGRALEDMIAGARVEVAPYKRHPADFVLWKPSKPGEPSWPSPWGEGRPGWHIECSAMIEANLGLPIDIHGGGHDLIFPHHENELAQGVRAHGETDPAAYARYWMHNGFLTLDAEKMSKSLGNVKLVHDLLAQAPGEAIRWALLSAHYRAPLDWTEALIVQSRKALDRLYGVLQRADAETRGLVFDRSDWDAQVGPGVDRVFAALEDDLNTPRAFAELFALGGELQALLDAKHDFDKRTLIAIAATTLRESAAMLGLLEKSPAAWFEGGIDVAQKERIDALVAERGQARLAKDWAAADRLRAELTALNVEVLDGPGGTATWRIKD